MVAKHASEKGKVFTLNLGAPYVCRQFKDAMMAVFPFVDVLFGNEKEAREFADVHNLQTEDVTEIARVMSKLSKRRTDLERMVIVTQGPDDVIVVQGDTVLRFPVPDVLPDDIVDTNGAGDAFVGGFIAMHARGAPTAACVRCGVAVAAEVIKNSGCTLPDRKTFDIV